KIDGEIILFYNISKLPEPGSIAERQEPIERANILVPIDYVGSVITICIEKRGLQVDINYVGKQVSITYDLPMIEVVSDF
ncbi:elongation factor 4, partial [Francisella tularensis subsp. holarctica]|nr:elongation factor 4 [Francisella tularensis subsp. holarctica]